MSTPLLEVRDLAKHFPSRGGQADVQAVDGVSFDLRAGESLGLVGESGCGKSTLARTILGLEAPSRGTVHFDGQSLGELSRKSWKAIRRRMQVVFQDPFASLDPRQSVLSILTEPLVIHGLFKPRERRLRALALLDAVGLGAQHLHRFPHEFSGGQRQRIGIARALALEPELLVCDEPLSALDVSIQAQIVNLFVELRQRFGLAYLFIAHDLAVVRKLCDRVAVMYLGRIVEIAESEDLYAEPGHPYTRALFSAIPVPDPRAPRPRAAGLRGEVADPRERPTGCAFHPRCPRAEEVPEARCRREGPALLPRRMNANGPARTMACHLAPAGQAER